MEFLKEALGEDLYKQVEEKLKDNKDIKLANRASGDYVSKQKYDDDIKAKDTKISDLTKKVADFDGVDVKQLQKDVDDWKTKYSADIKAERRDSAIKLAVAKAGARSEKALMGMLDYDKIKLTDDGKLEGLDDQIAQIKKDDAFLFQEEQKKPEDVELGGDHKKPETPEVMTMEDAVAEYYK